MSHVFRAIPKRLYAEGEYLGAYLGRPGDPRNDDDGRQECPGCDTRRWVIVLNDDNTAVRIDCEICEGTGYLDADGYPYKPQEEA